MQAAGRYIVPIVDDTPRRLYALGDVHLGNVACSVSTFKETVQRIAEDKFGLWIGLGDYAEFITHTDPRFDPSCVSPDIKVADLGRLGSQHCEMFANTVDCIKDKCVGLIKGNHELSYEKHNNMSNLFDDMCKRLGVKNLGYSCMMDMVFKHNKKTYPYRICAHHGAGAACTSAGKTSRLLRFMADMPWADIFIMGHVHEKKSETRVVIGPNQDCTKIIATKQLGVICGSFLKSYELNVTTYGEIRGYSPTALGSQVIIIHPISRKLGVEEVEA